MMDWFSKHSDMVLVLSGITASMLWMNGKFNEIEKQFSNVEKELAVIKTVHILKGIYPGEREEK